MEIRIDESKLNIFKPSLGKCMLGIEGKLVSSTPAPVQMPGSREWQVYMTYVGLGIRPTTSSSTYGCIHIRRHVTG